MAAGKRTDAVLTVSDLASHVVHFIPTDYIFHGGGDEKLDNHQMSLSLNQSRVCKMRSGILQLRAERSGTSAQEAAMTLSLVRGKHVVCKVTGPDSAEVVSDGAVLQQDGQIEAVGDYRELSRQHPDAEVIGSGNHIVIPGLVNDHFHVGLTPFQMGAPDLPLELWSLARIGVRAIDPYLDQLYGAVQMIETGTTMVQAIHSPGRGYGPVSLEIADRVVSAYQASGMRVSYAPSVVDQNSMVAGSGGGEADFAAQMPPDLAERYRSFMAPSYWPVAEVMPVLEEICRKYGNNQYERVQVTMAPSNVHRCSDELLTELKGMAGRYGTGIHIHL